MNKNARSVIGWNSSINEVIGKSFSAARIMNQVPEATYIEPDPKSIKINERLPLPLVGLASSW